MLSSDILLGLFCVDSLDTHCFVTTHTLESAESSNFAGTAFRLLFDHRATATKLRYLVTARCANVFIDRGSRMSSMARASFLFRSVTATLLFALVELLEVAVGGVPLSLRCVGHCAGSPQWLLRYTCLKLVSSGSCGR